MINQTLLKTAILNQIDARKITDSYTTGFDENGTRITAPSRALPHGDQGLEELADAIAQAVVEHLQAYLEVTLGTGQTTNVPNASLPYTTILQGVGGGIVGPVQTFPGPFAVVGGTITVPPGNIQ